VGLSCDPAKQTVSRSLLIVGAGPAAAGAALAAVEHADVEVTVIDVGGKLEQLQDAARERLASASPWVWSQQDIRTISSQPVESPVKGLPEKRIYGSDFPFRNFGQLTGTAAQNGVNTAVVSGAYGGFSNIWGAQVTPFTAATFREWPIGSAEMYRNYQRILREIPYAAEEDDLAELFPLLGPAVPLPRLNERSSAVLARAARHRERLRRRGVGLGRARLAMKAAECVRCGLCLTGCPYSLIYAASHTLEKLKDEKRVTYFDGLLAVKVEENENGVTVVAKELATGRLQRMTADRAVIACGAIGSSRLVMNSLDLFDTPARVAEAAQFMLPFVSAAPTADPSLTADFTLNQFNMAVNLDEDGYDLSLLHFYTFNTSFLDALPELLRSRWSVPLRRQLLRRLSVALGYLPSWASPSFELRASQPDSVDSLPPLTLSGPAARFRTVNGMLWEVMRRISASAPYLDLWPALPMLRMSASGKSYHWGGTFPHSDRPSGRFSSDILGRVLPLRRVHLADASVFPTVPATTFTLTIMANAHRITRSALGDLE
jgi:choline dehydrogenase-like flavoprotein